jgi:hypothetical protein
MWRKRRGAVCSVLICHSECSEESISRRRQDSSASPQNDNKRVGVNKSHLGSALQALKERRNYEVFQIQKCFYIVISFSVRIRSHGRCGGQAQYRHHLGR